MKRNRKKKQWTDTGKEQGKAEAVVQNHTKRNRDRRISVKNRKFSVFIFI